LDKNGKRMTHDNEKARKKWLGIPGKERGVTKEEGGTRKKKNMRPKKKRGVRHKKKKDAPVRNVRGRTGVRDCYQMEKASVGLWGGEKEGNPHFVFYSCRG